MNEEKIWEDFFNSFQPAPRYESNSLSNGDIYLKGVSENIPRWRERNLKTQEMSAKQNGQNTETQGIDNQYAQRDPVKTHPGHMGIGGTKGSSGTNNNSNTTINSASELKKTLNELETAYKIKLGECAKIEDKNSNEWKTCRNALQNINTSYQYHWNMLQQVIQ